MSANDHLNYRQMEVLMNRVNTRGGGFTVQAYGPDAGKEAEKMHMVGTAGHGLDIYPPEVGEHPEATTEQGMGFMETREDALRQPGMQMGGWAGPDRISLDVSAGFDRNTEGTVAARAATVTGNQQAYGTLHTMPSREQLLRGVQQRYEETENPFYGKTTALNTETNEWINQPRRRTGR